MMSIVTQELQHSKATLAELGAGLTAHPDDALALAMYARKAGDAIHAKVRTGDTPGAEKIRAEALALLGAIKPTTDEATSKATLARNEVGAAIDRATASAAQSARIEEMKRQAQASLPELEARLKAHPDDTAALERYQAKFGQEIFARLETDPAAAEALLAAYTDTLKSVQAGAGPSTYKRIDMTMTYQIEGIRQAVGSAKVQAGRIGKPAAPLNVEAWVNGSPLTDADLKGKVVLLESGRKWAPPFMAVVPFTQLRTWSVKYADKGLVLISLTSYSRLVSGMTGPEKQRAMHVEQTKLAELARDNALTHRIGIQKDDPKVVPPGATAFEHLVVIDREGKVRLISTGRPDLVKAVDDLLETLLGRAGPGAK